MLSAWFHDHGRRDPCRRPSGARHVSVPGQAPSESKGRYDYYKLVTTIPAEKAFRPLDAGGCPLAKKN
jgi:hypothetical protein